MATWLENGDENTKFFHAFAKGQKVANIIWSLKDQEYRPVTSFKGIENFGKNISRHYSKMTKGPT